jgi:hypothetical protein
MSLWFFRKVAISFLADFDEVLVPEQVWQEVIRYRPGAFEIPATDSQKSKCVHFYSGPVSITDKIRPLDFGVDNLFG